jgi:hypothetical protein
MRANGLRICAATFLMTMAVAGPQSLGVAAADNSSDRDSEATRSAAPKGAPSALDRRVSNVRAPRVSAGPRAISAPAEAVSTLNQIPPTVRKPATASARRAAATLDVQRGRPAGDVPATASARRAAATLPAPANSQSPDGIKDLARAASTTSESPPAPAATTTRAHRTARIGIVSTPPAEIPAMPQPAAAAPTGPSVDGTMTDARMRIGATAVIEAVNGFFDSTANWLSELPSSPITDFLQGALLLIRRTLFNQGPVAKPLRASGPVNEQIVGSVDAIDLEGDEIIYSVTQAPEHGTVTIGSDGAYTYTPDPDFEGPDAFTVSVDDTGWHIDLLDPLRVPAAYTVVRVVVGVQLVGSGPGDVYATYAPPEGCACQQTWSYNGQFFTGGRCGNPDSDPNGPWCRLESSPDGRTWSYCKSQSA